MYAINAQNNARSTECLTCALDAGELLLTYGAEVSRVEDTIQRLEHVCGLTWWMFLRLHPASWQPYACRTAGSITQSRRIKARVTNLGRVAKINALSRRFCAGALTLAEFRTAVQAIRDERPTPAWQELLLYMVISFSLSIFFGGNLADGIAASLSGMVLFAMIRMSTTLQKNSLLQTAICSAVTALAVLLLVRPASASTGQDHDRQHYAGHSRHPADHLAAGYDQW